MAVGGATRRGLVRAREFTGTLPPVMLVCLTVFISSEVLIHVRYATDCPRPPTPYVIPLATLRALVGTLPRPAADAPPAAWAAVAQAGLESLDALAPRDPFEALLAVQIVASSVAAADACRLAFAPDASGAEARRQRASAVALSRSTAALLGLLKQRQQLPAAVVRDWRAVAPDAGGGVAGGAGRPAEARVGRGRGATPGGVAADTIVRWYDEVPDEELAEHNERERRRAAGEPPLPEPPGPRRIYMHKPDDYALRWKPDPRNFQHYPGWENMTKPERRAFFGYTYEGPVAPLSMLSPEFAGGCGGGGGLGAGGGRHVDREQRDEPE